MFVFREFHVPVESRPNAWAWIHLHDQPWKVWLPPNLLPMTFQIWCHFYSFCGVIPEENLNLILVISSAFSLILVVICILFSFFVSSPQPGTNANHFSLEPLVILFWMSWAHCGQSHGQTLWHHLGGWRKSHPPSVIFSRQWYYCLLC